MVNQSLVALTNSVLGTGKSTARGNKAYRCPYCNHHKPKLEINFTENKQGFNPWHCWVCDKKGKRLFQVFKQAEATPDKISELNSIVKYVGPTNSTNDDIKVELPKEYKTFENLSTSDVEGRQALSYLKSRGLSKNDILKYNMGYCAYGQYSKMIIIPSYDANGMLNYFTARSFEKDPYIKYKNPPVSRDIVAFELFINWNLPIILCEGPFDALAIKRNVIPLLGKNIQSNLMKKIVTSSVEKIYIALDKDAQKQALNFCERLMNEGKKVYLVDLQDKDPSEMGFDNFTKLIQETYPITLSKLLERKLFL